MRSPYYIVEHPTRGCLREIDDSTRAGGRFSTSDMRTDESVKRYPSIGEAVRDRDRLAPAVRKDAVVRAHPVGIHTEWRTVA